MPSYNKVILMGNLTRNPEVRYTSGGSAVCEFGLAVTRKFTSNGQAREETCFLDIVAWGRQAEACGRYLSKGSPAFVEGHLQMDQWDDKETGKKRTKIKVNADRIQFLGTRDPNAHRDADAELDGNNDGGDRPQQSYGGDRPQQSYGGDRPQQSYGGGRPQQTYGERQPLGGDRQPAYGGDRQTFTAERPPAQPQRNTYQNEPPPPPPPPPPPQSYGGAEPRQPAYGAQRPDSHPAPAQRNPAPPPSASPPPPPDMNSEEVEDEEIPF